MKKTASLLLALTLIFALAPCSMAEDAISATVGGAPVLFRDARPYMDDGVFMLPVGPMADAMGLGCGFYPLSGSAVISNGEQSVELISGQRTIKLSGSTFIADEPPAIDESGLLYASGATVARLAQYFGLKVKLGGRSIDITFDSIFPVFVNGGRITSSAPVMRDGILYLPVEPLAAALDLEYAWNGEYMGAVISQRTVTVSVSENTVNVPDITFLNEGYRILYEDYKLYLDADTVIGISEYFGAPASYSYYQNGLIVSSGRTYNVKVNGVVVNFPDVQPKNDGEGGLIPLRPVAEALGCFLNWDGAEANLIAGNKTLTLVPGQSVMKDGRTSVELDRAPVLDSNRLTVSPADLLKIAERLSLTAETEGSTLIFTDPNALPHTPVETETSSDGTEDNAGIRVSMDGKAVEFSDMAPFVVNEHTLFPVRVIAEEMGLDVKWDGGSGVLISDGGDSLSLTIGRDLVTGVKDGEKSEFRLDVPVSAPEGHTSVQIRPIMEFFGAIVGWDGRTSTITITSPRDRRETSVRDVDSSEDFAVDLGFTVKAPPSAENVSFAVVNENTARVNYTLNGSEYRFNAALSDGGAVLNADDFSGSLVSRKTAVNGVPVTVYTGSTLYSTVGAIWTVGGLSFSLETSAALSYTAMLNAAETAAATFTLVREVEPEEVVFSPTMEAVSVESSSFFNDLGLTLNAPEDASSVEFCIYDGRIAEVRFYMHSYPYILRAARNGGDLTGLVLDTDSVMDSFLLSGASDNARVSVYRSVEGGRAGLWSWGGADFALICTEPSLPSMDFNNVCTMCGRISSPTLDM